MLSYRNDNYLDGCYVRRKNKTARVSVSHDDSTDQTCGNAPRGLVREHLFVFLICVFNAERTCKAVSEVV